MKKILRALTILLIFGALSHSAVFAQDKKDYGIEEKTLTVGISGNYKPFTFVEEGSNGEVIGFSMDFWKEFEKRTGIKVEFENTDFSGLLGLLESGRADVIDAQLSENEERKQKFDFTEPINYYGSVVVVSENNDEIKNVKDLKGKTIGIGSGNDMMGEVESYYNDGDIKWELYTSATLGNMLKDVELGRLDGIIAQNVQALMEIQDSGSKTKLTEIFDVSGARLVVKKGNEKLLLGLNEFIDDLREDGTLEELSIKWMGSDTTVTPEE